MKDEQSAKGFKPGPKVWLEPGCTVRVVERRGQIGIEKRLAGTAKRFVFLGYDDGPSKYARCRDGSSGVVLLLNSAGLEIA